MKSIQEIIDHLFVWCGMQHDLILEKYIIEIQKEAFEEGKRIGFLDGESIGFGIGSDEQNDF